MLSHRVAVASSRSQAVRLFQRSSAAVSAVNGVRTRHGISPHRIVTGTPTSQAQPRLVKHAANPMSAAAAAAATSTTLHSHHGQLGHAGLERQQQRWQDYITHNPDINATTIDDVSTSPFGIGSSSSSSSSSNYSSYSNHGSSSSISSSSSRGGFTGYHRTQVRDRAKVQFVQGVAHRAQGQELAFPGGFTSIDPFTLVEQEINGLSASIRDLLNNDHPALDKVSKYFFGGKNQGKRFRPAVVLLMSKATSHLFGQPNQVLPSQYRLAEIAELIHTASLLHDDVIDGSDTRRNQATAHMAFGNKVAILGGDFLLAKASIYTARLRHVEVIELLSTVIEHLVEGEFMQSKTTDKRQLADFDYYLKKSYLKTASLIANSSKAAVLLHSDDRIIADQAFQYGKNLGIAFQLVDDVLDYTQTSSDMGKPTCADLKEGIATAPVLFAAREYPEIVPMIARKFKQDGDVERALELVHVVDGVAQAKLLAESFATQAAESVANFPSSDARDGLVTLTQDVLTRQR